jgi:hypothetical protein
MTDRPGDAVGQPESTVPTPQTVPSASAGSAESPKPSRRRVRRRAERPGTNPSADDAPDVVAPRAEPEPGETQHDRWLREQRPPHWE